MIGDKMDIAKTNDLKPADWRSVCYVVTPDYKQLVACIEKYGVLSPLVILKDGTIIDGYHRWVIANELGIKDLPVIVVKANKVEAMLLHIDLNRYRGVVVAKFLSRLIRRIYQSGKYSDNKLRKKLGMTQNEFEVLLEGSLVKMRKIKQHTYSPAWVPIESASGEDIHIERPTGHSEKV
jgi:ParB-like chromosome segregation protein Spo0J|tara:strand:+ start:1654 stop:2190 length:537 start_codon:yes stop_codon:yes gene_type:complete